MIPQDHQSAHRDARWIAIENVGAYDIPPFGVCEVVDSYRPESASATTPSGGITVLKVQRPSQDEPCNWVVNWSCAVPAGETGKGTKDSPMNALVDGSGYSSGDVLGIEKDSFALTAGRCGFVVDGDYDATYQCIRVTRRDECPSEMMVRATECSLPGVAATAQPMIWDDSTCDWIDDPNKSEITISDPLCWRLALVGDKYEVRRPGGYCENGSCNYVPVRPFGLKRRVLIESVIECGSSGTATVLTDIDGDGTWAATDPACEISVVNTSNRRIACDADEYATAFSMEGECTWWLIPNARPLRATAVVSDNMCADDSTDVLIDSIDYLDACTWTTRETVENVDNPNGMMACEGDTLILGWNDSKCKWEVDNVEPHAGLVINGYECDGCTMTFTTETIGAQSCCDGAGTPWTLPTTNVNVITGAEVPCSGGTGETEPTACKMVFTRQALCVVGCSNSANPVEDLEIPFAHQEFMTNADLALTGGDLVLTKYYKEVCVPCADVTPSYDTDTVEGTPC